MSEISNLEPKIVWKHFDEIRKIPRCSKHEEKIREYVVNFAKNHNLKYKVDKIGNVVISKEASKCFQTISGLRLLISDINYILLFFKIKHENKTYNKSFVTKPFI